PATRSAQYEIKHEGGQTNVALDQEGNQAVWKSLGTFFFKPDGTNEVRLSDITSDSWLSVRYDALAWVPRTDSKPPSAEVVAIRDQGAGQFQVVWQGVDDASGVASFDVQVQRDGGEWQDWLTTTPYTNADYLVQDPTPAIYAFRVRARDWAGNTSDFQPEPHMNTSLATQ
ncbi:MAG TPA: Ig-like domain repeat protein, partial [Herpetosiphonaceae bacterium]